MTIDTTQKSANPVSRSELETIIINNLQKYYGNFIANELVKHPHNVFRLDFKEKGELTVICNESEPKGDTELNKYSFLFDSIDTPHLLVEDIKEYTKDILTDFVTNLSLIGLMKLAMHKGACSTEITKTFIFNWFLTNVPFAYRSTNRYQNREGKYHEILGFIEKDENINDFIKYTLAKFDDYLPIWQNNTHIVISIIKLLTEHCQDHAESRSSYELKVLWSKLLKQDIYHTSYDCHIVAHGLVNYPEASATVSFLTFYDFYTLLTDIRKAEDRYPITFKVNSEEDLTSFVNNVLTHLNPKVFNQLLSDIKNMNDASKITFDVGNYEQELDDILEKTNVKNVVPLQTINLALKLMFK